MNSILQFLKEKNLINKRGPRDRLIDSLSLTDFVDIAQELESIIKSGHKPVQNSIFSHSASFGLGGSSSECSHIGCRLERIDKLARFALMYSDKVFIGSFFSQYADINSVDQLKRAKEGLFDDLLIVKSISPLLENGLINFFAPETNMCFSCQARRFIGGKAESLLDRSNRKLQADYLCNMSAEAERNSNGYSFICNGPVPFFDHARVGTRFIAPEALIKRPSILEKIEKGNTVSLSKTLIKDLGLHLEYAHQIVANAIYGLATSHCLKTTFLTENDLHIQFLNTLHSNSKTRNRNLIAEKHLTSILPFVADVDLKNLIKLRQREEEAFILYRQALNQAIENFNSASGEFSEKDAQALYSDIIAPSLAQLDIKIKNAKKDLIEKPLRSLIGVVGVLSFGLLTGIVPSDISEIVKVLGLLKFGTDFIQDGMAIGSNERSVMKDQFYFLWKVRKNSKPVA